MNKPEARVAELEASCAAMREALDRALPLLVGLHTSLPSYPLPNDRSLPVAIATCKQALSTDAGANLLSRLRATEQVVEKAQILYDKLGLAMDHQWWDMEWLDLGKALDAYKETKNNA